MQKFLCYSIISHKKWILSTQENYMKITKMLCTEAI